MLIELKASNNKESQNNGIQLDEIWMGVRPLLRQYLKECYCKVKFLKFYIEFAFDLIQTVSSRPYTIIFGAWNRIFQDEKIAEK